MHTSIHTTQDHQPCVLDNTAGCEIRLQSVTDSQHPHHHMEKVITLPADICNRSASHAGQSSREPKDVLAIN